MACLIERLAKKGLQPHDVRGQGDCFFRSVSHQLFDRPDRHLEIRLAAVDHVRCYPEQYIEFVNAYVHTSWLNYLAKMSTPGEWCDNIIVQATANSFNCIINITETSFGFNDTTL